MKRIIVDVSSVVWMSLLAGSDKEFGYEVQMMVDKDGVQVPKTVKVNTAAYGYENAMQHLSSVMKHFDVVPSNFIFVKETGETKAIRKAIYAGYKAKRGARPDEQYAEFNKLVTMLCDAWKAVGAQVVTQNAMEADDVIGYLAKHLQGERIILTNDGDLAVNIGDGVHLYRRGDYDVNPYGPFPPKFIPVYKALVGDTSDNIPGAHGFGEKAFLDLYVAFGDEGLAALEDLIKTKQLQRLQEDVAEFPRLSKIMNAADMVVKSYQLACPLIDKVNTLRAPLVWEAGMVRSGVTDERLKPYGQQVRLVTADNYGACRNWVQSKLVESPVVALDIETATPPESDDWLKGADKVDVFGSELCGMGLTFGNNGQYTLYFSVNHKDTANVTSDQVADIVEMIQCPILIQNFSFEGPILYKAWGERFKNNGWDGFLPNVIDTKVLANYTNENLKTGLKQSSEAYLGYQQVTYDAVTSKSGPVGTLVGGKISNEWKEPKLDAEGNHIHIDKEPQFNYFETRTYKMSALTGNEVLAYGADDTICTSALYNHYRIRMEMEKTWDLAMEIEQLPAYVTALAFVQGTNFNRSAMQKLEAADRTVADEAWATVRQFLFDHQWEGTVCPVFTEVDHKSIKEAAVLLGITHNTRFSKLDRIADDLDSVEHPFAGLLASITREGNVAALNKLVTSQFNGEPKLDLDSPKQMKAFLYDTLRLPVRLINSCTPIERKTKPALANAVSKFKKIQNGSQSVSQLSDEEQELLKLKARTDDTAMDFALAFDVPDHPILKALKVLKTTGTRQKLFYTPYQNAQHWSDDKIHAQLNQCGTVTRRWSSSAPNLQQLPKRGEGVAFRRCFVPHKKDAVICSVDFAGQELRLQAGLSRDPMMLACYVGDHLQDMHSITASGAMKVVWSKEQYEAALAASEGGTDYERFISILQGKDKSLAKQAKDLRTLSKAVNFGSAYGCTPPKMQELLVTDLETATNMLNAKLEKFCGYEQWKEKVEEQAAREGLIRTELGGIRHLAYAFTSDDQWAVEAAARQASNFKIQSAGAELMKRAMCRLWRSGILFKFDMQVIAPIHDELCWSVSREHALESIRIVHEAISQPYTADFPVPFIGSISLGPTFGDQIECGEVFDVPVIQRALDSVFEERKAA